MKNIHNAYYTPGELAKMAGISKQLLLYYDKSQIFTPSLVGENGYRYYSLKQYFDLQMIVTMRKMNIPLKEIKKFIRFRKTSSLHTIYEKKLEECRSQIKRLKAYERHIRERICRMDSLSHLRLNQILLHEQEPIAISSEIRLDLSTPIKKRVKILAEFLLPNLQSDILDDYLIGYYFDENEFFGNGKLTHYYAFFQETALDPEECSSPFRPDLYLTLYCKCIHNCVPPDMKRKISRFITGNGLEVVGRVFLLPVINNWITEENNLHIAQVCIPIRYKEDN